MTLNFWTLAHTTDSASITNCCWSFIQAELYRRDAKQTEKSKYGLNPSILVGLEPSPWHEKVCFKIKMQLIHIRLRAVVSLRSAS